MARPDRAHSYWQQVRDTSLSYHYRLLYTPIKNKKANAKKCIILHFTLSWYTQQNETTCNWQAESGPLIRQKANQMYNNCVCIQKLKYWRTLCDTSDTITSSELCVRPICDDVCIYIEMWLSVGSDGYTRPGNRIQVLTMHRHQRTTTRIHDVTRIETTVLQ